MCARSSTVNGCCHVTPHFAAGDGSPCSYIVLYYEILPKRAHWVNDALGTVLLGSQCSTVSSELIESPKQSSMGV